MSRALLQRVLKVLKVKRLRLDEHLIPIIVEEIEAELANPEPTPVAWAAKSVWGDLEGLSFDKQPRFDIPLYTLDTVTK